MPTPSRSSTQTETGKRRLGVRGIGPDWSPDGKRIVFVDPEGLVAVVGVDGRGLRQLTLSGCGMAPPRWPPDGKQIAHGTQIVFSRGSDLFSLGDLYAADADGGGTRRITTGGGNFGPSWRGGDE